MEVLYVWRFCTCGGSVRVEVLYVVRSSWAALTSAARRPNEIDRLESCADSGPGGPLHDNARSTTSHTT